MATKTVSVLNANQTAIATRIANYGREHGYSEADISIAIKTAFLESSLGDNMGTPNVPGNTSSGLYQYNNDTWHVRGAEGAKNNVDNQIIQFYKDLTWDREQYDDPTRTDIDRDALGFDEYCYIKHHEGRYYSDPDDTAWSSAPGNILWNATDFQPANPLSNPDYSLPDGSEAPIPAGSCTPWDQDGNGIPDVMQINPVVNNAFQNAINYRDPLAFDLDGNGIQTLSANGQVLFDQNADGGPGGPLPRR